MKLKFERKSKVWIYNIVEYKQLTDTIFCFKQTQESNRKSLNKNIQGFIKTDKKPTINYKSKTIPLWLASVKDLEKVRKNGWSYEVSLSKTPFDDFGNDKYIPARLDYASHMIFDIEDNPLPIGVYYDYISASMNNRTYNLEGVLEVLKARKDIKLLKNKDKYTDQKSGIVPIPYYNAECGKDRTINFIWQASTEDYRKAWEVCLTFGSYPSTKFYFAIADLDLLGIEKHRKEKPYWRK